MKQLLVLLALAGPAFADEAEEAFVEANLIGIFYHEVGHALIDQLDLAVLGQEEDAADVLSIFLIDALWEPDAALDLAYDASFGFAAEALLAEQEGDSVAYWDVHGPDEQRFYNTVCVFYGADPEARDDFARDTGLPEERAEYCDAEYAQAADAWGPALDRLNRSVGSAMTFEPGGQALLDRVIGNEVAALNEEFKWPRPIAVAVEPCDEPNAFYDPERVRIVMCSEFVPHLRRLHALAR